MRLLFVNTRSDVIAGASIWIRDVALALRERGHHVAVVAGGDGPWIEELRERGLPVRTLSHLVRDPSPRNDITAIRELRTVVAEADPDVLISNTAKAGIVARIVGRRLGIPVVHVPHGWAFDAGIPRREQLVAKFVERAAAKLPATILNVSSYERDLAIAARVGRPRDHRVIHNGVPDTLVPLAEPGRSPARIIMVARFEAQKDHATLLRALAVVRHLEWKLDLIGTGDLLPDMRDLATSLGIAARVSFLGHCDDVAERLADAQIFALATHWESFPLSILEAMRAGLPVVASNVGGISEAVSPTTGELAAAGNPEAFAAALTPLLIDPAERARRGTNARQLWAQRFTHADMVDNVERLLLEIVGADTADGTLDHPGHVATIRAADTSEVDGDEPLVTIRTLPHADHGVPA